MKRPVRRILNRWLARSGLWLSSHALLTLVTLLLFLGITAGFIYALNQIDKRRTTSGGSVSRGTSAYAIACAHAAVDFQPAATAGELRQLLRAADAFVLYGPDEFGRFQLRLADGASGAGAGLLRSSALVAGMSTYEDCP